MPLAGGVHPPVSDRRAPAPPFGERLDGSEGHILRKASAHVSNASVVPRTSDCGSNRFDRRCSRAVPVLQHIPRLGSSDCRIIGNEKSEAASNVTFPYKKTSCVRTGVWTSAAFSEGRAMSGRGAERLNSTDDAGRRFQALRIHRADPQKFGIRPLGFMIAARQTPAGSCLANRERPEWFQFDPNVAWAGQNVF